MNDAERAGSAEVVKLDVAKAVFFAASLVPALVLLNDYLAGALATPWRAIVQETGLWSIRFLLLSLWMSPLVAITGMAALQRFRRMIGLFGAFYAAVHLFAWCRQYGFDWPFLFGEVALRFYLTIGALSALLLVPLALTSPEAMHRWLGLQRWQRLHALIYPVLIAALVHYAMARGMTRSEVIVDTLLLLGAFAWRGLRRYGLLGAGAGMSATVTSPAAFVKRKRTT